MEPDHRRIFTARHHIRHRWKKPKVHWKEKKGNIASVCCSRFRLNVDCRSTCLWWRSRWTRHGALRSVDQDGLKGGFQPSHILITSSTHQDSGGMAEYSSNTSLVGGKKSLWLPDPIKDINCFRPECGLRGRQAHRCPTCLTFFFFFSNSLDPIWTC